MDHFCLHLIDNCCLPVPVCSHIVHISFEQQLRKDIERLVAIGVQ
jgi:hypothetical protein